MGSNQDYYKILQVDPAAEPDVIEAAFRRLAMKYHPDFNASPDATTRMAALNEAYAVLSDPARRAQYDAVRLRGVRTQADLTPPPIRIQPQPIRIKVPRYRPEDEEDELTPHTESGGWRAKILAAVVVLLILGVIAAIGLAMSGAY